MPLTSLFLTAHILSAPTGVKPAPQMTMTSTVDTTALIVSSRARFSLANTLLLLLPMHLHLLRSSRFGLAAEELVSVTLQLTTQFSANNITLAGAQAQRPV